MKDVLKFFDDDCNKLTISSNYHDLYFTTAQRWDPKTVRIKLEKEQIRDLTEFLNKWVQNNE